MASPITTAAREIPITREDLGAIAVLTLDRPRQRNTLSAAVLTELRAALAALGDERSVRAVILAANGAAFCAGHDLKEITAHRADPDQGQAFTQQLMESCSALMLAILTLPQPVIAAVEGVATAAGCQLVATCDLAIASRTARFCTPGVDIGLFCSTPMVALSRNVARKHAMEMLLTGDSIGAADAYRLGLVNRVVAAGQARDEALRLAGKIASKSPVALKRGKEAFYRQIEMGVADAYDYTARVMVENMLAPDAVEGIGAFLEKRPPVWQHD
ncbi:MAG: enoyl-CoA hydratase [Hyphomicrobiales bacterium]|nr:enoyl-CoA hydratase [Hyphomicrobiales bacterium]